MKKEQLLEAIGYADDQLLMEAERTPRRSSFRVLRVALVAAIVAILTVTAMASTGMLTGLLKAEDNGSSMSNLSTGSGQFVYTEEGIYYGEFGVIYLSDFDGNLLKAYPLIDKSEMPQYMFVTEGAIIYVCRSGLHMQPKDGSAPSNIFPGFVPTIAYADGDRLYSTNGGRMLSRTDLVTFEHSQLLENVSAYFVDENYIYAVQGGAGNYYFRSGKDVVEFEKIELPFTPNKIIAEGDDLYICQWLGQNPGYSYQVSLVQGGNITPLPVYSWTYQVLDGSVLYLEHETYLLKCYNVSTGETTTLAENVYNFSVLESRYLCIKPFNGNPLIHDLQTGSCSRMMILK